MASIDTKLLVVVDELNKVKQGLSKVEETATTVSKQIGPKGDKGDRGDKGDKGDPGPAGKDGVDGKNGLDGKDGQDGVSVVDATIDIDNSLVLKLSDGNEIDAGNVVSESIKKEFNAYMTRGEILPLQTGNSGKYLKTDGNILSWDTLDGSDINLSSPPAIGNTTPNTGSFTQLTAQQVAVRGGVNLLLRSQEFNNAVWSTTNATISADVETAPNGTLTGDSLVDNVTSGTHSVTAASVTFLATTYYTASVYVKAAGQTWCYIQFATTPFGATTRAWFNLATGEVGTASNCIASITSAGSGWYRCTVTAITSVGGLSSSPLSIASTTGNATTTYAGNGTAAIYLWGAQLEPGAVVNTYIPTTSSAITIENKLQVTGQAAIEGNAVAQDVIVQGGNNLLRWSEDFSNALWTKQNVTVTTNSTTAPDGTITADKLVETITNAAHSVFTDVTLATTNYTFSFFAKAAERTWVRTRGEVGQNFFDLSNGAVGTLASGRTAAITSVGNGWYRISITWLNSTTALTNVQIGPTTGNGVDAYAGSVTDGLFIWGAQLELGTVASPYTPTTSAAVTTTNDITVPSGQVQTALGSASLPSYSALGDTNTGMFFPAADTVAVGTGGSERLRVGSAGNVSIGTTDTSNGQLTVNGSSGQPVIRVTNTANNNPYIQFQSGGFIQDTSSGNIRFRAGGATGVLQLDTNSTERMRITSAGDVGIGTNNPAFSLAISRTGSNPTFALTRTDASVAGSLRFEEGNSGAFINQFGSKFLAFQTANTERMRIDSSGNVGIGTTSPSSYSARFAVVVAAPTISNGAIAAWDSTTGGGANVGGTITMGGDDGASATRTFAFIKGGKENSTSGNYASYLSMGTRADGGVITERMRIDSSGNVGIGTSSPSTPLAFGKAVYGSPSSENFFRIKFEDFGGINNDVGIGQPISGWIGYNSNADEGHIFYSGTRGERFRIQGVTGDIVIGNGDTAASPANGVLRGTGGSGTNITGATLTIQGGRGTGSASGGPIVFSTSAAGTTGTTLNAATEVMRVTPDQRVGIGTSSPGAALQVVATSLQGIFEGSSQGAIRIKKAGVAGFQLYSDTAGTLGFYDDGSNSTRMYINASGNVGIGTTSPTAMLDVNSDTVRVRTARTPASATAAGNAGDICWDANYVYVCVATNTWKRSALSTW